MKLSNSGTQAVWASVEKYLIKCSLKNGESFSIDSSVCPLCTVYSSIFCETSDEKCPIYATSGERHCNSTPWYEIKSALTRHYINRFNTRQYGCSFNEGIMMDGDIRDSLYKEYEFLVNIALSLE